MNQWLERQAVAAEDRGSKLTGTRGICIMTGCRIEQESRASAMLLQYPVCLYCYGLELSAVEGLDQVILILIIVGMHRLEYALPISPRSGLDKLDNPMAIQTNKNAIDCILLIIKSQLSRCGFP